MKTSGLYSTSRVEMVPTGKPSVTYPARRTCTSDGCDTKWLVPEVGSIALAPGQTATVIVHVRKDEPKGQQQVAFIVPAPAGSGVTASGGVAVPFNYEPEAVAPPAPVTSGGATPWWVLALLPLVAVGIYMMSRRGRKRPRAVGF
jgi:hypothetical protein